MKIDHREKYDRFIDAIRLNLIVWREMGGKGFDDICRKLGISERTARRRYRHPESLTLAEFYAWCELYGKDPCEMLVKAFAEMRAVTSENAE